MGSTFYKLRNNGIRCISTPCFSIDETKLNHKTSTDLSGIRGALAADASAALAMGRILVAGTNRAVGKGGREVAITQYYTLLSPPTVDPTLSCSTSADCTWTGYDHAIVEENECYCATCPTTVLNVETATANQDSWDAACWGVRLRCPAVLCIRAPVPACVDGVCVGVY